MTENSAPSEKRKSPEITADGIRYIRIPVKTHVIGEQDKIADVIKQYASPVVQEGDIVFVSEKAVAITQKRAYPMKDIKPRKLAVLLSHYVTKTPAGIGLGIPETMEMALRECGTLRILLAAAVSAVTKLFGRKGDFYRIAGEKASAIDGPTQNTLPPYNNYVVLGPANPDRVAQEIAQAVGCQAIIVDLNDLGGKILGRSDKNLSPAHLYQALRDNPLGQSREQTPCGILRKVQ